MLFLVYNQKVEGRLKMEKSDKKQLKVDYIVQAALIAALYAVLTYLQAFMFPGSTSMAIQFRVSEVLCMLAVFTPAAIPGLTIGCLTANIMNTGTLPLDIVIGTLASLFTAVSMYMLRNVRIKGLPVLASFMPAIFNGILVGLEIEIFFIEGPFNFVSFLIQAGCVALGELGVCVVLGLPFAYLVQKLNLFKRR